MKTILLFGAGKSATLLIEYLIDHLTENNWNFIVCDADLELAASKTKNATNTKVVSVNVENDIERKELVKSADLVISMMPPALHFLIAKDCVEFKKHLLTASYVDANIKALEQEILDKKLFFLCEMGLDPGIDHMSAMKLIDSIKAKGGKITSFVSHCGGLIAPESDNNPWHYKITWNPRNVVLAGKDGAEYLKDNNISRISYNAIFRNCPALNIIEDYPLCWYPNRETSHYIDLYELQGISTFIRTTLRHPAFCRGWNKLVNIGLTAIDDFEQINECKTFAEWFQKKTARFTEHRKDWNNYLQVYITDPYKNEFNKQLNYLGIESSQTLPPNFNSSADILQYVFEKHLSMKEDDKDMIVMLHEIEYVLNENRSSVKSSLIVKGENQIKTAMAKTVGLPLGIATKLILQDKIKLKGLHIPTQEEIYKPVLAELEEYGIRFNEEKSTQ